jgi:hypothetical protein
VTTIVMAPVPGPEGPPETARKVRAAAVGADRAFRLTLQGAGLAVLVIMTTIGPVPVLPGLAGVRRRRPLEVHHHPGLGTHLAQLRDRDGDHGHAPHRRGGRDLRRAAGHRGGALHLRVRATSISPSADQPGRSDGRVPSVVYGLWGAYFLQEKVMPVVKWISSTFGWIPLLGIHDANPNDPFEDKAIYESSTFIAGSWWR